MYYNYLLKYDNGEKNAPYYKIGQTKDFKNRLSNIRKTSFLGQSPNGEGWVEVCAFCCEDENCSRLIECAFRKFFDNMDGMERVLKKQDYFMNTKRRKESKIIKELHKVYNDFVSIYNSI